LVFGLRMNANDGLVVSMVVGRSGGLDGCICVGKPQWLGSVSFSELLPPCLVMFFMLRNGSFTADSAIVFDRPGNGVVVVRTVLGYYFCFCFVSVSLWR
jgi:hypothetical protein